MDNSKHFQDQEFLYNQLKEIRIDKSGNVNAKLQNWYDIVIREIISSRQSKNDCNAIAKAVKPAITPREAKKSIKFSIEQGLLAEKQGLLQAIETHSEDLWDELTTRFFQSQMIDRAKEALRDSREKKRAFYTFTMTLTEVEYGKIKNILDKAKKSIIEIATRSKNGNRVFNVNMQAFPVSEYLENTSRSK